MLDEELYKEAAKLPFKERVAFLMSETEFDEWANPSEERLRSLRSELPTDPEDTPTHKLDRHSPRHALSLVMAVVALVVLAGGAWAFFS
ncbi:MAG: hypothetical protein FP826_08900 [Sphingomonadales bacterium]|nr:hypothetical protein [Sphingomonadales bacterium]